MSRLKLWYAVCDKTDETKLGPLVAGRLQAGALSIALKIQVENPDGSHSIGADALRDVRSPVPTLWADGSQRPPYDSGLKVLMKQLQERYGLDD